MRRTCTFWETLGYWYAECQTCTHRIGNSWASLETQRGLLTSTCSVPCHCRPLAFPLFGFWILSEHGSSISPNKGKRTEYKQFSKQMLHISVHATLSSLLCGCSCSHSVCPVYFTACLHIQCMSLEGRRNVTSPVTWGKLPW